MGRLAAVLRCRNLFATLSKSASAEWDCIVFGRCNIDQQLLLGDKVLDISDAEIAVTFKNRELVLAADDVRQWEVDNPCGGLWIDIEMPNRRAHSIQVRVNASPDVLERVWNTDLRSDDIMIGVEFDELIPRGENGANAFLTEASIHFHSRVDGDGIFGPLRR